MIKNLRVKAEQKEVWNYGRVAALDEAETENATITMSDTVDVYNATGLTGWLKEVGFVWNNLSNCWSRKVNNSGEALDVLREIDSSKNVLYSRDEQMAKILEMIR